MRKNTVASQCEREGKGALEGETEGKAWHVRVQGGLEVLNATRFQSGSTLQNCKRYCRKPAKRQLGAGCQARVLTQAEEGEVVPGVPILNASLLHGLAYDVIHHLDCAPLPEDDLLHCCSVRHPCSCQ